MVSAPSKKRCREADAIESTTARPLSLAARKVLANEQISFGKFVRHGMLDHQGNGPEGCKTPLDPAILEVAIDFFDRMAKHPLGKLMLRRESVHKLRNFMHGETLRQVGVPQAETHLAEDLIRATFGSPGYHGVGYVMASFFALGIASEEELQRAYGGKPLGPGLALDAWKGSDCMDYEWVMKAPKFPKNFRLLDVGARFVRTRSCGTLAYPYMCYTGALPVPECVTMVSKRRPEEATCWGPRGPSTYYLFGLLNSARIIMPHCRQSFKCEEEFGTDSDIIKCALPMNAGSFGDVRCTHGYSVKVSPDEVTDFFFQGFESKVLFLTLCIDYGYATVDDARAQEVDSVYFEDRKTMVLAVLHDEENTDPAKLFVSEEITAEAAEFAHRTLFESDIFSRWCAFVMKLRAANIVRCKRICPGYEAVGAGDKDPYEVDVPNRDT